MNPSPVDFKALLERLMPLEDLPPVHRRSRQRRLQAMVSDQIRETGRVTLEHLGRRGGIGSPPPAGIHVPYALEVPPGAAEPIGPGLPSVRQQDGILLYSRVDLPARAHAGLDQVRRLLRLDDPLLSPEPRQADARADLIERLSDAGRDVLGVGEVRFIPLTGQGSVKRRGSLDTALAHDVLADPRVIHYCPDTERCPRLETDARQRGVRSLAMVGVAAAQGEKLGLIEVASAEQDAFGPEDLALVALLADFCAMALERAARIEKLMFIDPLTSAYNRSYFDLQVQNEMARAQREQSSMALCIADVDDFKSFNTAFGYEAGNRVLVQVAQSLKHAVRPFDTVARWGGEEFGVLLTSPVSAPDVATVSERLRSMVERQSVRVEALDRRSHRVGVTVSIGVALFPDHAPDAAGLWRAANQALLTAKQPPKNRVVFYRASRIRRAAPGDARRIHARPNSLRTTARGATRERS